MKEFRYERPPDIPEQARIDLIEIRNITEQGKKAQAYKAWQTKYGVELTKRREIQDQNISNFCYLVDKYLLTKDEEIKCYLNEYSLYQGFYVKPEGDGRWLRPSLRTGKPDMVVFLCDYKEAMKDIEEARYEPTTYQETA